MEEAKENFIPLAEAAKETPYSQEYLSLLARRGKLKAKKFGNDWFTTRVAVQEYLSTRKESATMKKIEIPLPVGLTADDLAVFRAFVSEIRNLTSNSSAIPTAEERPIPVSALQCEPQILASTPSQEILTPPVIAIRQLAEKQSPLQQKIASSSAIEVGISRNDDISCTPRNDAVRFKMPEFPKFTLPKLPSMTIPWGVVRRIAVASVLGTLLVLGEINAIQIAAHETSRLRNELAPIVATAKIKFSAFEKDFVVTGKFVAQEFTDRTAHIANGMTIISSKIIAVSDVFTSSVSSLPSRVAIMFATVRDIAILQYSDVLKYLSGARDMQFSSVTALSKLGSLGRSFGESIVYITQSIFSVPPSSVSTAISGTVWEAPQNIGAALVDAPSSLIPSFSNTVSRISLGISRMGRRTSTGLAVIRDRLIISTTSVIAIHPQAEKQSSSQQKIASSSITPRNDMGTPFPRIPSPPDIEVTKVREVIETKTKPQLYPSSSRDSSGSPVASATLDLASIKTDITKANTSIKTYVDKALADLANNLSRTSTRTESSIQMVTLTQRIDQLDNIDITNGINLKSGNIDITNGNINLT